MNNIGLYIDADNISYKNAHKIFNTLKKIGNLTIKKIFGDWSKTELKSWYNLILEYGLEPIQCIRHNKKQSTDIYLITQMSNDSFFFPHINHYALVSSDSDFIHLCQNLKKIGKIITIFGNKSSILKNYCDNFVILDENIDENVNQKNMEKKSKKNNKKDSKKEEKNNLNEELDSYLKDKMTDSYIISLSKFKKRLSNKILKKYNRNHKNLETYLQNKTKKFIIYQKKKGHKKSVVYVEDILKNYKTKKNLLNNIDNFIKNYNDLSKKINIQNLANKIF